jgi:PAS domain S-box-containing protein
MNLSSSAPDKAVRHTSPLRRQLLFSHLSVAWIGLGLLCIALASTYGLRARIVLLANEGGPLAQASLRVLAGVHHSLAGLRGWVNLGDERFLEDWRSAWHDEIEPALALLKDCRRVMEKACGQERLRALDYSLAELRASQRQVQDAARAPGVDGATGVLDWDGARRLMTQSTEPLAERAIALAKALAADAQTLLEREAHSARAASAVAVWLLTVLIVSMLTVAFVMSRQRAEDLVGPIASLVTATRQLAAGRLSTDIPVEVDDELGQLTRSFNVMRGSLRRAEENLREANALLERRVSDRTAELTTANDSLRQEVSVRIQAERALRTSEARLRAIADAIPDPVFVVDEEGRYLEVLTSQQNLFGGGKTALKGTLLREAHSPELADFFLKVIRQALTTQQIQIAEYELPVSNGRRWFESRTAPIAVPFDAKPAAIVVARDITQRKLAEAQLRQAQKMEALGQLTGGIAHDFNNLLAVILGNLEWLDEQLSEQPSLRDLVQRALGAVERGANLTRRLLTFSRHQPLRVQAIDLNALVLGMIDLMRRTLGETIAIRTALATAPPVARVDAAQLENALLNLALNARDAMPQGGTLTVETAAAELDAEYAAAHQALNPGSYVMLAVSDTGIGMAKPVLERACEPFFTTKASGKGSGLGLSMVYGLVTQSGGHIAIDSEVDRGTTVRVYLPRVQDVEQAGATAGGVESADGQGELILVVEDDDELRRFAIQQLEGLGYATREADDAETALALLRDTPQIALLFTDVILPGRLDGIGLAEQAKRHRPELPILFTSGYTEQALGPEQLCERAAFLAKPYRKSELGDRLRALLDG